MVEIDRYRKFDHKILSNKACCCMRIRVGTFPVSKRRLVYFWFGTQVQGVSFLIGLLFKYVWEQAIKD